MTHRPETEKSGPTARNRRARVPETGPPAAQKMTAVSRRILKYTIYAGIGALGAGLSVAGVMGFALIGLLLPAPDAAVFPNLRLLNGAAVIVSLGVCWLLNRLAHRLLPHLFGKTNRQARPIILTVGLLTTGLTEPLIFGQGF